MVLSCFYSGNEPSESQNRKLEHFLSAGSEGSELELLHQQVRRCRETTCRPLKHVNVTNSEIKEKMQEVFVLAQSVVQIKADPADNLIHKLKL